MASELPATPRQEENRFGQLRERCLVCTRCHLSQTRTQVVFGSGNPHSPLVLIGEGPGEQEDALGVPFVGRSGQLLDEALQANGIGRKHVYVTNVLKCRACVQEGRRIMNRAPSPDEVEACRPWLAAELAAVKPLVILCIGGPAASWVIHPEFRILKERGRWFETPYARSAMATLHPAYILRQQNSTAFQEARATLVRDIAEARQRVVAIRKGMAAGGSASPALSSDTPPVLPEPVVTSGDESRRDQDQGMRPAEAPQLSLPLE